MGVAVAVVEVVVEEEFSNNCALVGVVRGCFVLNARTDDITDVAALELRLNLLVFLKLFSSPLRC